MIYITGDTHGLLDVMKLEPEYFKDSNKLTRDDFLIVCGDFGALWSEKLLNKYISYWEEKKYTILFCDGNHENFDMLNSYKIETWNNGKIHKIRDNIIHLMRGQIYNIDKKTFFVFGGGTSIDKNMRIEGLSWWSDELASYSEIEEALKNLDNVDNKVDYVITHAAPASLVKTKLFPKSNINCPVENFLDEIYKRIKFKRWFCGHYHFDKCFNDWKIDILYDNIVKIKRGYPLAFKGPIER